MEQIKDSLLAIIRRADAIIRTLAKSDSLPDGARVLRAASVEAYEVANAIQWSSGEHNADLDDILPGEYKSADALIESMRA
jgi:hypothetical protein